MGQSFIACDREQSLLMPRDVREWLPEGHLAWFVIDAVAGMDLVAFYAAFRASSDDDRIPAQLGRVRADPGLRAGRRPRPAQW